MDGRALFHANGRARGRDRPVLRKARSAPPDPRAGACYFAHYSRWRARGPETPRVSAAGGEANCMGGERFTLDADIVVYAVHAHEGCKTRVRGMHHRGLIVRCRCMLWGILCGGHQEVESRRKRCRRSRRASTEMSRCSPRPQRRRLYHKEEPHSVDRGLTSAATRRGLRG